MTYETRAPVGGTVEEIDGRHVLRFERRFAHPIERVWRALTDPDELIAWLGDADIDLVEGGRIELRWQNTDEEGNRAVLHGTITRLDPPRLLEYEGDIHGRLRWELREDAPGCILALTSTLPVLEGAMLPMVLAGWHIHLEHLAAALAGDPVDWPNWRADHMGRWTELRDDYAAKVA